MIVRSILVGCLMCLIKIYNRLLMTNSTEHATINIEKWKKVYTKIPALGNEWNRFILISLYPLNSSNTMCLVFDCTFWNKLNILYSIVMCNCHVISKLTKNNLICAYFSSIFRINNVTNYKLSRFKAIIHLGHYPTRIRQSFFNPW